MGVIEDMAREDWQRFSQEIELHFCAPSGERSSFMGIGTRNYVKETLTDGQEAIGEVVRVAFSETILLCANPTYPIRNHKNDIALKGHLVSFKDAQGNLQDYAIKLVYADQTVGLISCDCEFYEEPEPEM